MRACVLLISAAVATSACGRSQCSSFEQPFDVPPDFLALSTSGAKRELLLGAYRGAQAHPLDAAGTIGPRLFSNARDAFADGTWLQFRHLALKSGERWRVIAETAVVYVSPADVAGRVVPVGVVGSGARVVLERVVPVGGRVFVVAAVGGQLRLGELLSDDQVRLLGEVLGPVPTIGVSGLKVPGGWDPVSGSLLLELNGELVAVSTEGTVLSRAPMVEGASPGGYALSWVRLPGGKWAGLHGHSSFFFQPGNRGWSEVIDVGETGTTTAATQALDDVGTLWIAVPNRDGEVVIRTRGPDGAPGAEVRTRTLVTHCDTLLVDR